MTGNRKNRVKLTNTGQPQNPTGVPVVTGNTPADPLNATNSTLPPAAERCPGECDGAGRYPIQPALAIYHPMSDHELREVARTDAALGHKPADGVYYITCETCNGSGRRA